MNSPLTEYAEKPRHSIVANEFRQAEESIVSGEYLIPNADPVPGISKRRLSGFLLSRLNRAIGCYPPVLTVAGIRLLGIPAPGAGGMPCPVIPGLPHQDLRYLACLLTLIRMSVSVGNLLFAVRISSSFHKATLVRYRPVRRFFQRGH